MARLVEDSDDEFPDLSALVYKHAANSKLRTKEGSRAKTPVANAVQIQKVLKPSTGLQNPDADISFNDLPQFRKKPEDGKPRKRVLNKTCDNALLRPFDPANERKPSVLPLKNSRFTPQITPMRPRVQGNDKASCGSHMGSSPEKDVSMSDSTGLSDFIVNDSSYLEYDEEDSSEDDIQPCPTISKRRLVRGRRSPGADSYQTNGNCIQPQQSINKPPLTSKLGIIEDGERDLEEVWMNSNSRKGLVLQSRDQWTNTDLDEPLALKSTSSSEKNSTDIILGTESFVTPPTSPQKTQKRLASPQKGPRIPLTPHRPSMDAFWDPDVINEWNEEYSPQKTLKSKSYVNDDGFEISTQTSPNKRSQLVSDRKASQAKRAFGQKKNEIAVTFLLELDGSITDGKISEMAAVTGGIKIIWSKKLNTTAGRANWKRETIRSTTLGADGKPETKITYRHYASIELAEKVIDDEERLLNVIAHEFCHLANFMVSGIRNNPHGKEFKSWALKCSQQFGNRGIHVTTKHSYDIDYKYIWECINCGTKFKRHSKSIDPLKHQCGSCKSKLVQTKPVPKLNTTTSDYQLFMKDNMKRVKEQNPGSPQKHIMTLVGKMYQEHKASKLGSISEKVDAEGVDGRKGAGSRDESSNDSQVDLVMRRLNFLDLTDP